MDGGEDLLKLLLQDTFIGWLITGTSTWILNWLSKSCSWATWQADERAFWVVVCLWYGLVLGVYWVPPYAAFITSKMNSLRYWQLIGFLTLSLLPTWLIPTYGWRWRSVEVASTGYIPFKLGIDEDSSSLTSDKSGVSTSWVPLWAETLPVLVCESTFCKTPMSLIYLMSQYNYDWAMILDFPWVICCTLRLGILLASSWLWKYHVCQK